MPANTAQNAISMKRSAGEIFVSASEKRGDCPKISIIQTIFCKIQTVAGVQRRELWDMLNQRGGIFIVSEPQNVSSSVGAALNRTCRPAGAFRDWRSFTINMPEGKGEAEATPSPLSQWS